MDEEEVSIEDLVNGEEIHVVLRGLHERHERGQVRDLRTSRVNPNLRLVTVNGIPLAVDVRTPRPNAPRFYRRIPVAGQTLPPASQGTEGQPLVAGSLTPTQMTDIPLDELKVGTPVIATQIGGNTIYRGLVKEVRWYPTKYGKTEVVVWIDRVGGKGRIGFRLTAEDETPQWTFRKDPEEMSKYARSLAEVSASKPEIPEDILEHKVAPLLGLKKTAKKGGRRRKTRKSRR